MTSHSTAHIPADVDPLNTALTYRHLLKVAKATMENEHTNLRYRYDSDHQVVQVFEDGETAASADWLQELDRFARGVELFAGLPERSEQWTRDYYDLVGRHAKSLQRVEERRLVRNPEAQRARIATLTPDHDATPAGPIDQSYGLEHTGPDMGRP